MEISGEGGYGGTHWIGKNVEEMWQAVENQDTTAHYKLLSGWRRSYELTFEHMAQVKNYRENLAAAWPPEISAASAAYMARLDSLIGHLQETYEIAAHNHSIFAATTLALSASRSKLKPLYDEYVMNQARLTAFAANLPERPVGAGKSVIAPPKPPVLAQRQERLNEQARAVMYGLSSEIVTASTEIKSPTPYDPSRSINDDERENKGHQYIAPRVPPVAPFTPGKKASSNATQASVPSPLAPSSHHGGLVLGEAQPQPAPPAKIIPEVNPSPSDLDRSALPGVIGPVPTAPVRTPSFRGLSKTPSPGSHPGRTGATGPRGIPPGGVIGMIPGSGSTQPTSERPVQRVNPVGGVIQPSSHQARPGSTNSIGQPLANMGGRPAPRQEEIVASPRRDPDNPWETAKGGPAVIVPAEEQRIDPGPAIGLR